MPIYIRDVCKAMESWAPLQWQESYDNAGLLLGQPDQEVTGILVSLDCTEEVIKEALAKKCNVIIAHHPIIFKGLKSLTGKNYVEKTVIAAIKNDIAIYASHTNLDHAPKGVSYHLAKKIGIDGNVLAPVKEQLKNICFFVPKENQEEVRFALHQAGAGNIGEYSACSFSTEGEGRFTPSEKSNPTIGQNLEPTTVNEVKIEMIYPKHLENQILEALKKAHPYEEVAYYLYTLDNTWNDVGAGFIGEIEHALSEDDFIQLVKEHLDLKIIRHTPKTNKKIKKIAVCGGAGSFLIKNAIAAGADAYLTGDIKYHEFFDAENQMLLIDIGHYESEVMIKDAMCSFLSNIFCNFAVLKSEINTNPVNFA
ncbi:MAG: hypothetical protein RJA76_419 [Bacteroidota bacterium]|jgi:dinuclear metal center YbgI/SA1388 family protein